MAQAITPSDETAQTQDQRHQHPRAVLVQHHRPWRHTDSWTARRLARNHQRQGQHSVPGLRQYRPAARCQPRARSPLALLRFHPGAGQVQGHSRRLRCPDQRQRLRLRCARLQRPWHRRRRGRCDHEGGHLHELARFDQQHQGRNVHRK